MSRINLNDFIQLPKVETEIETDTRSIAETAGVAVVAIVVVFLAYRLILK